MNQDSSIDTRLSLLNESIAHVARSFAAESSIARPTHGSESIPTPSATESARLRSCLVATSEATSLTFRWPWNSCPLCEESSRPPAPYS
jgi:hypothetical protein